MISMYFNKKAQVVGQSIIKWIVIALASFAIGATVLKVILPMWGIG